MAVFPSNLRVLAGISESPSSVVIRSDMERGIPKVRRIAADSMVTVPLEVLFNSRQEAQDFEDWFYGDINAGADFFDWTDPRTNTVVEARIVGGELGPLTPVQSGYNKSRRSFTIEYVRPAL